MFNRRVGIVAVAGCMLAVTACSGADEEAAEWEQGEEYQLTLGAGNPAQASYAISSAHKPVIESGVPGVTYTLQGTQGGEENMQLLEAGEVNVILSNSNVPWVAYNEEGYTEIASLFPLYSWEVGAIVLADDNGATNFRDLAGMRMATGPVGSGAAQGFDEVLSALGMDDEDFRSVQRAAPEEGFSALQTGGVDAVFWGTAHPAGPLLELQSARSDMDFVSFDEEDMDAITEAYPYYHAGTISADVYGTSEDRTVLGGTSNLFVSTSVPEALVYETTKALWEGRSAYVDSHPSQARLDEELVRIQAGIIPFHPGAQRFFEEAGVLE